MSWAVDFESDIRGETYWRCVNDLKSALNERWNALVNLGAKSGLDPLDTYIYEGVTPLTALYYVDRYIYLMANGGTGAYCDWREYDYSVTTRCRPPLVADDIATELGIESWFYVNLMSLATYRNTLKGTLISQHLIDRYNMISYLRCYSSYKNLTLSSTGEIVYDTMQDLMDAVNLYRQTTGCYSISTLSAEPNFQTGTFATNTTQVSISSGFGGLYEVWQRAYKTTDNLPEFKSVYPSGFNHSGVGDLAFAGELPAEGGVIYDYQNLPLTPFEYSFFMPTFNYENGFDYTIRAQSGGYGVLSPSSTTFQFSIDMNGYFTDYDFPLDVLTDEDGAIITDEDGAEIQPR